MYANGDGVQLDYKKAVAFYQASAKQGFKAGQEDLAGMYQDGQGVPKDLVLAYAWAILSGGGTESELSSKVTKKQAKEAQKLASEWKVGQLIKR